jgi:protein-S-isoprenylcysteine O-methyltransferase Ste14
VRSPAKPGYLNPRGGGTIDDGHVPRWRGLAQRLGPVDRNVRIVVNLAGAASAAFFARASLGYFAQTHRLIGGLFLLEQAWFVVAFLFRRPARATSQNLGHWLLAAGGTFGGLLFRPAGLQAPWSVHVGFGLQVAGLLLAIGSLVALGRSFGFVAADRGLVTRGPYAVIRHPVYAGYLLVECGYVAQFASWRNVVVLLVATACNVGRMVAEERVLSRSADYDRYRQRVRWRLIPGLW